MTWIEQIRVRSAEYISQSLIEQARHVVDSIRTMEQVNFADVFRHKDYPNDFVTVIRWSAQVPPHKSKIGVHLASYLQGFGLVEHSIWITESDALRRVS